MYEFIAMLYYASTMKNTYNRTINTGLTGAVNFTILDSVMGQLSDGKWENSPGMRKWWENANITQLAGPDSEVVIEINDGWNSGFHGMGGDAIRNKFASWIKAIVYDEMNNERWDRTDTTELDYLSSKTIVTVADAYRAYDVLKGREIRLPNPAVAARKAEKARLELELAQLEAQVAALEARIAAL